MRPSKGVNPMVVSMDLPLCTAHMLLPAPAAVAGRARVGLGTLVLMEHTHQRAATS